MIWASKGRFFGVERNVTAGPCGNLVRRLVLIPVELIRNPPLIPAQAGIQGPLAPSPPSAALGPRFRGDERTQNTDSADALGYNRPSFCSRTFISAMRCSPA